MAALTDASKARQLAEAIAADIRLYNGAQIEDVTDGDRKLALLAAEIAEGRELFLSRVSPEIQASGLYDRVIAAAFGASGSSERSPGHRVDVAAATPAPRPQLRFDDPLPEQNPGGSAYRQAEIKAICLTCQDLASAACRRCGAPFCGQHAPPRGARCTSCEAEYARGEQRWGFSSWKTRLVLFAAISIGALAFAIFALGGGMIPLVVALILGALAVVLPFKLDRWLFLLERGHTNT